MKYSSNADVRPSWSWSTLAVGTSSGSGAAGSTGGAQHAQVPDRSTRVGGRRIDDPPHLGEHRFREAVALPGQVGEPVHLRLGPLAE